MAIGTWLDAHPQSFRLFYHRLHEVEWAKSYSWDETNLMQILGTTI